MALRLSRVIPRCIAVISLAVRFSSSGLAVALVFGLAAFLSSSRVIAAQWTPNVSPNGGAMLVPPNATAQQASFTVSGLPSGYTYTFEWYCYGAAISCSSPNGNSTPSQGWPLNWTIRFNSTSGGTGRVVLKAFGGGGSDSGWFNITVGIQEPAISLAPYHDAIQPADPFNVVQSVTSSAYQSRNESRALTLQYNSSTVRPTPVVAIDVSTLAAPYQPSGYMMQVKRTSPPTFLTLLNGATAVYYAAPTTATSSRLVAAIDAKANNLTTGWYDVDVSVTA